MIPGYIAVYPAFDRWYYKWEGQIKEWYIRIGDGAYTEMNYDLYMTLAD